VVERVAIILVVAEQQHEVAPVRVVERRLRRQRTRVPAIESVLVALNASVFALARRVVGGGGGGGERVASVHGQPPLASTHTDAFCAPRPPSEAHTSGETTNPRSAGAYPSPPLVIASLRIASQEAHIQRCKRSRNRDLRGFGTARQRVVLERWTNPKPQRRTCSSGYGLPSCRGKSAA
jgi:hypothetical protein